MPPGSPYDRTPLRFVPARAAAPFSITGTVVNGANTPVVGATVDLFESSTRRYISTTTTDANGVFVFKPPHNGTTYMVLGDMPGSPELAGCTIRNIQAIS